VPNVADVSGLPILDYPIGVSIVYLSVWGCYAVLSAYWKLATIKVETK
jgi:hypothetical protein